MMEKKSKILLIVLIILAVIVAASYFAVVKFDLIDKIFGDKEKTEEKKEEEKIIPKLKILNEDSNTRSVAVMINNNHSAWPHAGLQDAFLCYELIVEGGITRILAVYKDVDIEKIGSVRSARHYFLDYALENDAIFVHFGHSDKALSDIKTLGVNNINGLYDDKAFWRDTTLKKATEHTAFTSIKRINDAIESKKYRNTSEKKWLFDYSIEEIDLSKNEFSKRADEVIIQYSNYQTTKYVYDEIEKVYKLYMSNKEHKDAITDKQYTVKNIITYKVKNTTMDSYGRQDLKNVGSGEGYFISNGYAVEITWSKSSRSSQTIYKYKNGEEIKLNDGNTWVHIQPIDKNLNIISNEVEEDLEVQE